MGKNKAPGVFDHAEFRGLFVIVLFRHATQSGGKRPFIYLKDGLIGCRWAFVCSSWCSERR